MAPGDPKSEKIERQVSKSEPKGTKREPKGAKSEPKGIRKRAKGRQKGQNRDQIQHKNQQKDKVAKSMVFWSLKLILVGSVLGWNSTQNQ